MNLFMKHKTHEKPYIKITLTDTKPTIFDSKVGGFCYIPHDENFPCDSNGNQLRLLAQIDCSQVNLEDFPKSGLLQFWILNSESCGYDLKNPRKQDGFRVIYYSEIDKTVTEQEVISKFIENRYDDEVFFPVKKECGMLFTPEIDFDNKEDESEDACHQIGGYPCFVGFESLKKIKKKHDFLLFQLDMDFWDDDELIICWENAGIGNFFINSKKLKKLDFSDVWYNCSF